MVCRLANLAFRSKNSINFIHAKGAKNLALTFHLRCQDFPLLKSIPLYSLVAIYDAIAQNRGTLGVGDVVGLIL